MSVESNSNTTRNSMSFQDLKCLWTGLCRVTIRNINRLQHPKGTQHVPPSWQTDVEETNHYLLPILTLPFLTCNAKSPVCATVCVTSPPASTSYLCLEQRVWQGHCGKGLVCLLDIDGDLIRRRWWRWLLLKGQRQKVKITTDVIKNWTWGKHSTTLSLQNLRSGIHKGQLLQPWAETQAA